MFIALGGTGLAASQLGKNSVGTKQLKNNAVGAAKIKNGAVTQATISSAAQAVLKGATGLQGPKGEVGAPATKLFAVVSADGKLIRGSGVTSTSQGETKNGVYRVVFNQDVSACAFIATPAIDAETNGDSTFPNPAEATVGPLKENANGVVVVRAAGGEPQEPASGVVHVAVFCRGGGHQGDPILDLIDTGWRDHLPRTERRSRCARDSPTPGLRDFQIEETRSAGR